MIYDRIENLSKYLSEKDFKIISDFIKGKNADSDTIPRTNIDGDRIRGMLLCYDTLPEEECYPEAHDKYVDIQIALDGAEGGSVFEREGLEVKEEYNPEGDIIWYYTSGEMYAHFDNIPGYFSMLWPHEAHRTKEITHGKSFVKKIVIKLDVDSCIF